MPVSNVRMDVCNKHNAIILICNIIIEEGVEEPLHCAYIIVISEIISSLYLPNNVFEWYSQLSRANKPEFVSLGHHKIAHLRKIKNNNNSLNAMAVWYYQQQSEAFLLLTF